MSLASDIIQMMEKKSFTFHDRLASVIDGGHTKVSKGEFAIESPRSSSYMTVKYKGKRAHVSGSVERKHHGDIMATINQFGASHDIKAHD